MRLALLLLTAGCHTFSGLDDFTVVERGGASAVGGEGGSGATGGSDATGGSAGDGGSDEGGNTGTNCSTQLTDDFSTPLDTAKWSAGGQHVATQGGVLTLAWEATTNLYAGVSSVVPQNLIGCSMHVELVTPPATSDVQAFMYAGVSTDDRSGFFVLNNVLRMVIRTAGSHTADTAIAFDSAAHRWWRVREQDGRVFWDTSADGVVWVEQVDAPSPGAPHDLAASRVSLGGASPAATAGAVAFDNFNLPP